jgi:hypothetical protein
VSKQLRATLKEPHRVARLNFARGPEKPEKAGLEKKQNGESNCSMRAS